MFFCQQNARSRRDAARARRFQAPLANIKHDLFLGPKNYKKLALFYYTHTHTHTTLTLDEMERGNNFYVCVVYFRAETKLF